MSDGKDAKIDEDEFVEFKNEEEPPLEASSLTSRGWAITEWEHLAESHGSETREQYWKELVDGGKLAWIHRGPIEVAPSTGKRHRHTMVWCKSQCKKTAIYKIFGYTTWVKRLFHAQVYKKYCDKEGVGWTYGDMSKSGQRNDIRQAYDEAKASNGNVRTLMEAVPEQWMKYRAALTKVAKEFEKSPPFRAVDVKILNGKPGTGKSHYPHCVHDPDDVYVLTKGIYGDGKSAWRGYKGQKVLVLEEFTKPWVAATDLNSILDGQPFTVNVLYGQCYAAWTTCYIICNRASNDYNFYSEVWQKFPDLRQAFERRVSKKWYFDTLRRCPHIDYRAGKSLSSS
jgi:hypothetical protein